MPPTNKKTRQGNALTPSDFDYLNVKGACEALKVGKHTIMDALQDIPGVVRISARGIRIPRAGLAAWLKKMEIPR